MIEAVAIAIDREAARDLAPRFEEALGLVHNEFLGLDRGQQYRNAFARLLKADPLGRVLMLGTDQRDLFVPVLRQAIEATLPANGHLLDLGAGDGQTFSLVADAVPAGTKVSIEEPNPAYVAAYRKLLAGMPRLEEGMVLAVGFDEMAAEGGAGPSDGSVDLVLAIHMIYFLRDLRGGLGRMVSFLRPGGALFVVLADEARGYTGAAVRAFVEAGGDTGDNARHLAAIAERQRLLGVPEVGGGAILAALGEDLPELRLSLDVERQPSRLYGHCLADILALANITSLSETDHLSKFDTICALLRETPEAVDLRVEEDGPRRGMWSVTQPQLVVTLRREA